MRLAIAAAREIGLDGEEIVEGSAFLPAVLAGESGGVEVLLALRFGHGAEIAEGTGYGAAAVVREGAELRHGAAHLLALRGRKALQLLVALENAISLLGPHGVELAEAIAHTLLSLGRKLVEAGLAFERALLLGNGQVAVAVHPFGEMLAIAAGRSGVRGGRPLGSGTRRRRGWPLGNRLALAKCGVLAETGGKVGLGRQEGGGKQQGEGEKLRREAASSPGLERPGQRAGLVGSP